MESPWVVFVCGSKHGAAIAACASVTDEVHAVCTIDKAKALGAIYGVRVVAHESTDVFAEWRSYLRRYANGTEHRLCLVAESYANPEIRELEPDMVVGIFKTRDDMDMTAACMQQKYTIHMAREVDNGQFAPVGTNAYITFGTRWRHGTAPAAKASMAPPPCALLGDILPHLQPSATMAHSDIEGDCVKISYEQAVGDRPAGRVTLDGRNTYVEAYPSKWLRIGPREVELMTGFAEGSSSEIPWSVMAASPLTMMRWAIRVAMEIAQ